MAEIILIIVTIIIVFGVGKLPEMASMLGRMRSNFKKGLQQEAQVIDITPEGTRSKRADGSAGRKPGKFEQSVDEAHVEDPRG